MGVKKEAQTINKEISSTLKLKLSFFPKNMKTV